MEDWHSTKMVIMGMTYDKIDSVYRGIPALAVDHTLWSSAALVQLRDQSLL